MAGSDFGFHKGLDLSRNSRGMSYLYGLSDFWSSIFNDTAQIETLLELSTFQLSELYSEFLQRCSVLDLDDIQLTIEKQSWLTLLSEKDRIHSEPDYTYQLPNNILSSNYVTNRPFLPTRVYENDVHYHIDYTKNTIKFFNRLANLEFPSRKLPDGTLQYSVWMVESTLDEHLIYENYAKLIDINPDVSTQAYKDYVKGLYYVYSHGPIIQYMIRGFNLSIGLPLARDNEEVLVLTTEPDSSNWLVITDKSTYTIPYGLPPTVQVGDYVTTGTQLADWVELKDYTKDGDWWINLHIPGNIISALPSGVDNAYATAGSYPDYIMRNYLKNNSFLVNVKVTSFRNGQPFGQLANLLETAKPSYTVPVYIWSVEQEDVIHISEQLNIIAAYSDTEHLMADIRQMRRNNAASPYYRGESVFTRQMTTPEVDKELGRSNVDASNSFEFQGSSASGFAASEYHKYRARGVAGFWQENEKGAYSFTKGTFNGLELDAQGNLTVLPSNSTGTWVSQDISLDHITAYEKTYAGISLVNPTAASNAALEYSTDQGTTWTKTPSRKPISGLASKGASQIRFRVTLTGPVKVNYISFWINPGQDDFIDHTDTQKAWLTTLYNRRYATTTLDRGMVSYQRDFPKDPTNGVPVSNFFRPLPKPNESHPINGGTGQYLYYDTDAIPLYITSQADLMDKLVTLGLKPQVDDQFFIPSINLASYYNTLFFKGSKSYPMGRSLSSAMVQYKYTPAQYQVTNQDALYVSKIEDDIYGVYWIPANLTFHYQPYIVGPHPDDVTFLTTRQLYRTDVDRSYEINMHRTQTAEPFVDRNNNTPQFTRGQKLIFEDNY